MKRASAGSGLPRDGADVQPGDIVSTTEAARILGVSTPTIQLMQERGELEGWKTRGGHRRILLSSVLRFKEAKGSRDLAPRPSTEFRMLVIDDDEQARELYSQTIEQWGLPISLSLAADGTEGLLSLARSLPDVLIVDLAMPLMNGFEMLRRMRSFPEFNSIFVVVVTGLDQAAIAEMGGIPNGVLVYRKPIPFEKLQGFVEALLMKKQVNLPGGSLFSAPTPPG